jgi:hypothetical protein
MRQNIGEVRFEPFSPLSLLYAGQVMETDPTATIYLYAFADEDALRHEAFHSFELLAMQDRPMEWQQYYLCMGNTEAKLSTHLATLLPVPPHWLPSDSSATVYGETNHFEDGAEAFVHHRPKRKWDCVCRFVYGIPQDQSHLRKKIAKSDSTTDSTVLSFIRRNFHDMARRGLPADPTILSIIRYHFLDQDLPEKSTPDSKPNDLVTDKDVETGVSQ